MTNSVERLAKVSISVSHRAAMALAERASSKGGLESPPFLNPGAVVRQTIAA
jgi:hypothetical protein